MKNLTDSQFLILHSKFEIHIFGTCFQYPVSLSNAPAARKSALSAKCGAMICSESGRPSREKPDGIAMAGTPTRFAGAVKMSDKYIDNGSSVFAPILNAASGVVGVSRKSNRWKAAAKSSRRRARTACARP